MGGSGLGYWEPIAERYGLDIEVVNVRTYRPLDIETIARSVRKTNYCVVADQSWPFASVGSHLGWLISRNAFDYLDAPMMRVAAGNVPVPRAEVLEDEAIPNTNRSTLRRSPTFFANQLDKTAAPQIDRPDAGAGFSSLLIARTTRNITSATIKKSTTVLMKIP